MALTANPCAVPIIEIPRRRLRRVSTSWVRSRVLPRDAVVHFVDADRSSYTKWTTASRGSTRLRTQEVETRRSRRLGISMIGTAQGFAVNAIVGGPRTASHRTRPYGLL